MTTSNPMIDDLLKDDDGAPDAPDPDEGTQGDDAPVEGSDDKADDKPAEKSADDKAELSEREKALQDALTAERHRSREARAEAARLKAEQKALEAKPKAFGQADRLAELEALADDDDADMTAAQRREYARLSAEKAIHDREQLEAAETAKSSATRKAVADESISAYADQHPDFDQLLDAVGGLLTRDEKQKITDAGTSAGEVAHELLKAKAKGVLGNVTKLLNHGAESNPDRKPTTNNNGGADPDGDGSGEDQDPGDVSWVDLLAGTE